LIRQKNRLFSSEKAQPSASRTDSFIVSTVKELLMPARKIVKRKPSKKLSSQTKTKKKVTATKAHKKPVMKLVKKEEPQHPPQKIHPFAAFAKSGPSYRQMTPQMQRFANHDVYRKKAV